MTSADLWRLLRPGLSVSSVSGVVSLGVKAVRGRLFSLVRAWMFSLRVPFLGIPFGMSL